MAQNISLDFYFPTYW